MATTPVADLNPVRILSLPKGKTLAYEKEVEDKTNENSATVVTYQAQPEYTKESNKTSLLNSLVSHWLEEPFFDDLRTKQ